MSTVLYDLAETTQLPEFAYDVKILYQLLGHKFSSFEELCRQCFDGETYEPHNKQIKLIRAHLRSYHECKININQRPFEDIIPQRVLADYSDTRKQLIDKLYYRFTNDDVLAFYHLFFPRIKVLHNISKSLNLKFNFVGSKNGRLTCKRKTFNPYSLPKKERSCIKARPGYHICEYDLKSSQPRVAIFSTFDSAFKERFRQVDDIYACFPGDRQHNKIAFLKWMYGSEGSAQFDNLAKPIKELRSTISFDAHKCGIIHNRFRRPLFFSGEPENVVFQNYIASTEADALYETVSKMQQKLQCKKSRILFPFYDAVVCEIADNEADVQNELGRVIEENYMDHVFYCRFPVDIKTGQNFGELH